MEIVTAAALALGLMVISVFLHYEAMALTRRFLESSNLSRRMGVFVGMMALTLAQVVSVGLYALAIYAMDVWPGFGALEGEIHGTALDYFYFSLMSYTTLGVGDIYPVGEIRIVSGLEALNGFALIGWTASFAYTLMRDGWKAD